MSGRAAAFFDLDGTIVASDIVRYGVEIRTAGKSAAGRALWVARFLPRIPWYLALDTVSRAAFQRSFYRLYAGMTPDDLAARAEALVEEYVVPRIHPEAEWRIERHQARGDRTVLVTGSIEGIARPIAEHLGVNDLIAPRLRVERGRFTGELETEPLAGDRKAGAVRGFAEREEIDLSASFAYADSADDVAMLETVGRPAVVNPAGRLLDRAIALGWDVYRWPVAAA